jgi:hypothetical protein
MRQHKLFQVGHFQGPGRNGLRLWKGGDSAGRVEAAWQTRAQHGHGVQTSVTPHFVHQPLSGLCISRVLCYLWGIQWLLKVACHHEQQVLARMRGKRNPLTLLVGM